MAPQRPQAKASEIRTDLDALVLHRGPRPSSRPSQLPRGGGGWCSVGTGRALETAGSQATASDQNLPQAVSFGLRAKCK